MLKNVMHIGITVSNIEQSIAFYRDILGLAYRGELTMEGIETDKLFGITGCKVKVAYLNGSAELFAPPIELIQFLTTDIERLSSKLSRTSISEICFQTEDIESFYNHLKANHVECISAPQEFDFSQYGFGKSKAIYFKDPDGIILEAIQNM